MAGTDLSHRYAWADVVDQLLADEQVRDLNDAGENETLWAMTDHLGTIRQTVDSNGQMRMERFFDAFGNAAYENFINAEGVGVNRDALGATSIAFAFTGRLFDATTGLQNNLHRWYDPTVGRWLSEDPIGWMASERNLYSYVDNDPISFRDPTGLLTAGGGAGFNVSVGILHVSASVDVHVGFWWFIPMDFSVGGTLAGGPGGGLGAGLDVHGTVTNADTTASLRGSGEQYGVSAPVGSAAYVGSAGMSKDKYSGVEVGVGPQIGGGAYLDNTETESAVFLLPWNPNAKWWFGIKNPFK